MSRCCGPRGSVGHEGGPRWPYRWPATRWGALIGRIKISLLTRTAVALAAGAEPRLRVPLYIVTPMFVLFIGVSRIFLGVHWATDVLAGFAAGGFVLVAGVLTLGRAHRADTVEER